MKLIKSGSSFSRAISWGGGKFKRSFLPALKVQTEMLHVLQFSFLHFLHIKFPFPFCFKVHCPENKNQFFSERGFKITVMFFTLAGWFTVLTTLFFMDCVMHRSFFIYLFFSPPSSSKIFASQITNNSLWSF